VVNRLVDIKVNIKIFMPIASVATMPEILVGISYAHVECFPQAQKILLYHFTQEYSRLSYLSLGKQWLKKKIATQDVYTN
jgi:hypothetical protein